MSRATFLLSATLTAAIIAALSYWFFPYAQVGADTDEEHLRVWMLILWSAGIMAICFGVAGLFGPFVPPGFRDVAQAGSIKAALEIRKDFRRGASAFFNFAGWTVITGLTLLVIYFSVYLLNR